MAMVLPAANGPDNSARSRSAFHSGHCGTSAQTSQMAVGAAVVSMFTSRVHMAILSFFYTMFNLYADNLRVDYRLERLPCQPLTDRYPDAPVRLRDDAARGE